MKEAHRQGKQMNQRKLLACLLATMAFLASGVSGANADEKKAKRITGSLCTIDLPIKGENPLFGGQGQATDVITYDSELTCTAPGKAHLTCKTTLPQATLQQIDFGKASAVTYKRFPCVFQPDMCPGVSGPAKITNLVINRTTRVARIECIL